MTSKPTTQYQNNNEGRGDDNTESCKTEGSSFDPEGIGDLGVQNDTQEYEDGPPSFEKVLECLGMPGRFQISQIALANLGNLIVGFMMMSIVFVGYTPYHECRGVNNTDLITKYTLDINGNTSSARVSYESCDIKIEIPSNLSDQSETTIYSVSCPNSRDFFSAEETTYTSEWDLVCESKGQVEFTQTTFTIGQIVGGLISSPLADRFGRKHVVVISSCLCCFVELIHIFAPNIFIIYIVKFISGLVFQAVITSITIFGIEQVTPKHRQHVLASVNMVWVATMVIVGGVAYFIQDKSWRYFHGISLGSGLITFLLPFFLRECPRWLAANNRHEEALKILKEASKQNGKDFEIIKQKFKAYIAYRYPSTSIQPLVINNTLKDSGKSNNEVDSPISELISSNDTDAKIPTFGNHHTKSAPSPFSLLCHKHLLVLIAVGWYLWLTNILTYYGLFITSSELAGNRFLNFILMSFVELPSYSLALYLLTKLGRRLVFALFMGLAGLSLMVSALMTTFGEELPGSNIVNTVMFIFGKFSITGSFITIYVITPELFPTNVRTTAHGFCSCLGRLGSMVAPFLRLFHQEVKWGPALLFTTMCFVAVFMTLYLPETKDRDLPTTLEDVVAQMKTDRVKKGRDKNSDVMAEG